MKNVGDPIEKRKAKNSGADRFVSGIVILSFSTLIVKIIGVAYKIPMLSYLGTQGMGYFNSAYEIYAVLCVISTAGLPIALSMMISEQRERKSFICIDRIYKSALAVFLILGTLGTIVMFFGAERISNIIGNDQAYLCLRAISPSLFFICFSSAVRGYFQGFERMTPTAVSQLIEALGKLILGVIFARIAIERGFDVPVVAAWAIFGLSLGVFLASLYLMLLKAIDNKRHKKYKENAISFEKYQVKINEQNRVFQLLRIAVPITLSATVISITRAVDMILIMRRLQNIGINVSRANEVYGAYTTLAVPVFGLIPSLITPIALALVPQLAAAIESGSKRDQILIYDRSVRMTVLLAMPATLGIIIYSEPILSFLFSGQPQAVDIAAPLLSVLGGSVLFSGLITTCNAILQSYRQASKPIISMTVGAVVKIVFAYVLIGIEGIGVYGAPISTFLCNLTVTVMNFYFLGSNIPKSVYSMGFIQIYIKPFFASIVSVGTSFFVYVWMSSLTGKLIPSFLIGITIAVVIYILFSAIIGSITSDDIEAVPVLRCLVRTNKSLKIRKNNTKFK